MKKAYNSAILIVLFRNIIKSLDEKNITIVRENIIKYYELFMEHFHKGVKKEDKNDYRKIAIITSEQEEVIIGLLNEEIKKEKSKKQKQKKEKEKEKEKNRNKPTS